MGGNQMIGALDKRFGVYLEAGRQPRRATARDRPSSLQSLEWHKVSWVATGISH